ncbi:hypothetical protein Bbelb_226680 [Branchiostoma belcheri]|nr:hypothetical protein Bbelb_226680 [Branchiostoma belcheri]
MVKRGKQLKTVPSRGSCVRENTDMAGSSDVQEDSRNMSTVVGRQIGKETGKERGRKGRNVPQTVECPVCSCAVPQRNIDSHLDICLLRGEKKESLRSSGVKPNTSFEEAPPKKPSPKSSAVSTEQEDKTVISQPELSSDSNSAQKPPKVLDCSPPLSEAKENIRSAEMREYQRASPEPGTTGSEPSSPKPVEEVAKGVEESSAGSSHSDLKGTAEKNGAPDLITAAMLEEEEKLHKELEEEEKERMERAREQWDKRYKKGAYQGFEPRTFRFYVNNPNHKTILPIVLSRLSRLTHLLKKSNTYTEFLLKRMERQAEEAKRKAEARRKRLEKQEEKKRQKEAGGQEVSVRRSDRHGHDSRSPVKSTPKSPGRSKTAAKVKTEPEEAGSSEDGKQAKKRKREDDSEYCLADYIMQIMEKEKPTDTFHRVIDGKPVSDRQPELFSGGVLREYQLQGMDWMKVLYENGVNGILADEMGLGKTVQCIALFAELIGEGMIGPFMIVAPLSTLSNWYSEFRRFSPKVPVLIYHGTQAQRTKLRRKIFRVHGELGVHPIVITSYEITMRDSRFLAVHHWKYIIVDEGHRIKNLNCRLIREIKKIPTANKILLTGTPLQNNLAELWSLLHYLLPEVFDDLGSFEEWFDFTSIDKLAYFQVLTPFVLRRLKTDVDLNIPPKKELLVYAPLTSHQQTFYKATMDRTIIAMLKDKDEKPLELSEKGRPKRRAAKKVDYQLMMEDEKDDGQSEEGMLEWVEKVAEAYKREVVEAGPKTAQLNLNLKNIMMQLRKICNHPYLIEYPLDPATQDFLVDERLVESSGKLLLLDKMLPMLQKEGHKVLIFSQMTKMMDVLEDFCLYRQHKYCRLDGTMAYPDRQEQIDTFNRDPEYFVFLLSTRAGGLGINLTAADTVIIYDSDWNPQCDLQAQDRCHRIGQTRPVVVYRLVTANTIDQKIVERAAGKRKLEKMVMHKGKFKGGESGTKKSQSLIDPHELLELLKSRDHDVVRDCNDVISTTALRTLLDRSDLLARYLENKEEVEKQKKGKRKVNPKVAQEVPGLFKVIEEDTEGTELKIFSN